MQSLCFCCGIRYQINSTEKPSVVSHLTSSWHFLEKKESLKSYFYRNPQLWSFLLLYSLLDLVKLARVQFFSRRTTAILHTVFSTFPKVLIRRFCLTIKSSSTCWSFPLFSRPLCLIQGWYCKEKLDASHTKGLKG